MLKSMTAYGRATYATEEGRFVAEIQSLNRKFQEITILLPKELGGFETEMRKWISSRIPRGKITLRLSVTYQDTIPFSVTPNLALAKQLKAAWEKIAADLGMVPQTISLDMLAKQEGILLYANEFDEEAYSNSLKNVVETALNTLIEMKEREGRELMKDFVQRIENLKDCLEKIKKNTLNSTQKLEEKLKKKMEEILPGRLENEERLMREICLYTDKVDISEEITRFASHIGQFSEILTSSVAEKGKTLEFLLQEMLREVNTMGSKSDDVNTTRTVVEMKGEIEKIKEQVQNVE